jgi:hypothetical protein
MRIALRILQACGVQPPVKVTRQAHRIAPAHPAACEQNGESDRNPQSGDKRSQQLLAAKLFWCRFDNRRRGNGGRSLGRALC